MGNHGMSHGKSWGIFVWGASGLENRGESSRGPAIQGDDLPFASKPDVKHMVNIVLQARFLQFFRDFMGYFWVAILAAICGVGGEVVSHIGENFPEFCRSVRFWGIMRGVGVPISC